MLKYLKPLIIIIILILISVLIIKKMNTDNTLPIVAIANYGPHTSLEACIKGIKLSLEKEGYIENKNIRYAIADVGFNAALIPQMVGTLQSLKPKVMVVMTTPVAQFAKGAVHDTPLIYSAITDPVAVGLGDMIGSSDKQNMDILFKFAKQLLPKAKKVGLLYSTAESNDRALINMMEKAAKHSNLELITVPIDEAKDVPIRMEYFNNNKNKVDFIYVGTSGPIQPTLPVISAKARAMNIPVFNADKAAVESGLALASFGVEYEQVGVNTGKLILNYLNNNTKKLTSIDPGVYDHTGVINTKQAEILNITIPKGLKNVELK